MEFKNKTLDDLVSMIEYLDSIIFKSNPVKEIKILNLPKNKKSLVAAYHFYHDVYIVNNINKKKTDKEFIVDRRKRYINRIILETADYQHFTRYTELPLLEYEFAICVIAAHEIRHRHQLLDMPNLFKYLIDYNSYAEFQPLFSIIEFHLNANIEEKLYSPKDFIFEFDAMIVAEIFIIQVYMNKLNGLSFKESLKKSAKVITMNSMQLLKLQRKFCFIGKNYFKNFKSTNKDAP